MKYFALKLQVYLAFPFIIAISYMRPEEEEEREGIFETQPIYLNREWKKAHIQKVLFHKRVTIAEPREQNINE